MIASQKPKTGSEFYDPQIGALLQAVLTICGFIFMVIIMIIGNRYGFWTITGSTEKHGSRLKVLCTCTCGNSKKVSVDSLKRGLSKSCGCYRSVVNIKNFKGKVKKSEDRKVIFGFGVNDSCVSVMDKNNKLLRAIYMKWYLMISRCYSERCGKSWGNLEMYRGCSAVNEWSKFSVFLNWAKDKYFEGSELDKDLLVDGNKIYGPETCCFIPSELNKFIRISNAGHYDSHIKRFRARCANPFTKKNESLGLFNSMEDANSAWKKRKHELACQLADLQADEQVANALRLRYAPKNQEQLANQLLNFEQ